MAHIHAYRQSICIHKISKSFLKSKNTKNRMVLPTIDKGLIIRIHKEFLHLNNQKQIFKWTKDVNIHFP